MQIKLLALIIALFLPNMVFCKPLLIKCNETTGTRRFDIFKINNPEFFWYYENEWYELAVSNEGVAKDWKVDFSGLKIRLFNEHMNWLREIDLKNMTAYMKFPSGEYYLYECNNLER